MKKIEISKKEANQILHEYLLSNVLKNKTKSFIKKEINKGNVKVNRSKVKDNYVLKEKDVLTIYTRFSEPTSPKFMQCQLQLNLFYEDDNIIIIDKPKDVLCQEDKTEKVDTLNNAVKKYCYEKHYWDGEDQNNEPALIHRIDRNTSGLIIAGKNKDVIKILNKEMLDHHIQKKYLTIVHGEFFTKRANLQDYIRQAEDKNKMFISKDEKKFSKPITTLVERLFTNSKYSLLEVDIKSGKKHQIRAHLSFYGFPIIGDFKYSGNLKYKNDNKSQVLISNKIIFNIQDEKLKYLNNLEFTKINLKTIDDYKDFIEKYTK